MRQSLSLALFLALAAPAGAQSPIPDPRAAVDLVVGYTGFVDESLVDHTAFAATIRYQVTRRLSIGPEIVYMVGPGHDRDLALTGNAIFDFLVRPPGARAPSVNPYLVVGGGMMHHRDRFGDRGFSSFDGAWTAGAGARVWLTDRLYALGEYRVGWEPHVRVTGGIGVLW
jgi:hypothetical protein